MLKDTSIKLTSSRFKVVLPRREHLPVQVMPDDHSKSVPPLPIPNRTVKRYYADDSAATSVKVGYRQASYSEKTPYSDVRGFFTSGVDLSREVPTHSSVTHRCAVVTN